VVVHSRCAIHAVVPAEAAAAYRTSLLFRSVIRSLELADGDGDGAVTRRCCYVRGFADRAVTADPGRDRT